MAAFYAKWYKQTVSSSSEGPSTSASDTLLTPAQVTICSVRDKLVYNIEYKQNTEDDGHIKRRRSRTSGRQSTVSSSSNTFAAENSVASRFHSRNHTRSHSRQSNVSNVSTLSSLSSLSSLSDISAESMWDDWIVKFLDKKTDVVEDSPMEEWIFSTKA